MIELIPAIDIINGQCVRLTKGNYNNKTTYNDDPVNVAYNFESLGFKRLHIVDLDGARSNHIVNIDILRLITSKTSLVVDFGGGIKTDDDIDQAFSNGASMVTIGSVAVTNPTQFKNWIQKYGCDRLILGADVKQGKISINGWKENSDADLFPFLNYYVKLGIKNVVCTEISKDGTLTGPDISLYKEIMKSFPQMHLIASGGVSSNDDIEKLESAGIPAVVFGKAFYEGRLNVENLMKKEL